MPILCKWLLALNLSCFWWQPWHRAVLPLNNRCHVWYGILTPCLAIKSRQSLHPQSLTQLRLITLHLIQCIDHNSAFTEIHVITCTAKVLIDIWRQTWCQKAIPETASHYPIETKSSSTIKMLRLDYILKQFEVNIRCKTWKSASFLTTNMASENDARLVLTLISMPCLA